MRLLGPGLGEARTGWELTASGAKRRSAASSSPEGAPSQTRDAARAALRTDVLSLGAILYQMLSGKPPWGAASGVGAVALQMAHRGGARVFAVVRRAEQLSEVRALGAAEAFLADDPALADRIREAAPSGVHRIAEVDFAAHVDVDAAVIATGGAIAAYASSADRPTLPYWTLAFADVSLHLLGSDDFPPAVKAEAAAELTAALLEGRLRATIAERLPLDEIALAHERVESGAGGRVLLSLAGESATGR